MEGALDLSAKPTTEYRRRDSCSESDSEVTENERKTIYNDLPSKTNGINRTHSPTFLSGGESDSEISEKSKVAEKPNKPSVFPFAIPVSTTNGSSSPMASMHMGMRSPFPSMYPNMDPAALAAAGMYPGLTHQMVAATAAMGASGLFPFGGSPAGFPTPAQLSLMESASMSQIGYPTTQTNKKRKTCDTEHTSKLNTQIKNKMNLDICNLQGSTMNDDMSYSSSESPLTNSFSMDTGFPFNGETYVERRRKNNEAAKRSRDTRRGKEEENAIRAAILEQENLKLRAQVAVLKSETTKLHCMLYQL